MALTGKNGVAGWFLRMRRRIVQSIAFLALHSSWGPDFKMLCVPVLSCHSCALSWFTCPIGVFVHYSGYRIFPFLAAGTVILFGLFLARFLCGWVCPFGFLQDLLHRIPSPTFRLPRWTAWTKYVVLIVTVGLLPFLFGESTVWSFCRVCPASALQVTVPNLLLGSSGAVSALLVIKLVLLVAVLLSAVFVSRSFCTLFCPIGALLAPLNHISFLPVSVPTTDCISCRKCDRACPTDALPSKRAEKGRAAGRALDCIACRECHAVCPQGDARKKRDSDDVPADADSTEGGAAPRASP